MKEGTEKGVLFDPPLSINIKILALPTRAREEERWKERTGWPRGGVQGEASWPHSQATAVQGAWASQNAQLPQEEDLAGTEKNTLRTRHQGKEQHVERHKETHHTVFVRAQTPTERPEGGSCRRGTFPTDSGYYRKIREARYTDSSPSSHINVKEH